MQQRCRRPSGESSITVRRSGHDPFEQTKHAAHAGHAVERRDEMHLARTWIGKAGIDSAGKKRTHQALGTVHELSSITVRFLESSCSRSELRS
jgi:hypothetical protein